MGATAPRSLVPFVPSTLRVDAKRPKTAAESSSTPLADANAGIHDPVRVTRDCGQIGGRTDIVKKHETVEGCGLPDINGQPLAGIGIATNNDVVSMLF